MPQLDFSTFTSQLFWLFISFCSIYAFVSVVFVPRVRNFIYIRRNYVQEMRDEARIASEKAKEIEERIVSLLSDAKIEASTIILNAKSEAEDFYNTKIKEVDIGVSEMIRIEEASLSQQYSSDVKKLSKNVSDLKDFIMSKVSNNM
ncbi:ATP synthase subunit b' [Candidatus Cyrtobacter comes]|uniref:ATP synthase subunit b n=1 Tax=Candidatus Cyrtobacter comes TaxID=675776 RepID=A0ABU5L820_9RICK|nr:hypothetical protein [Candidatus Cyrtobacter comes]MDZ5762274.1 ATP synthase subunit b' [Candidatus Cyrtobacter comes]